MTTEKQIQIMRAALHRARHFRELPPYEIDQLTLDVIKCKRAEVLVPEPGRIYVVQSGQAREFGYSDLAREALITTYREGDSLGWYPTTGYIDHRIATMYIVVDTDWRRPALHDLQVKAMADESRRLRAELAVIKTTSAKERILHATRQPGENNTALAARIGCSRELVSKVLHKTGHEL